MADRKISELGAITSFDNTANDCVQVYVPGEASAVDRNKRMTADSLLSISRSIPQSGSDKTSSYELVASDAGKYVGVGSGGSIEVPDSIFSNGDAVLIINNHTSGITITNTITTAYVDGVDAASVTLAAKSQCVITFISGTVCYEEGSLT